MLTKFLNHFFFFFFVSEQHTSKEMTYGFQQYVPGFPWWYQDVIFFFLVLHRVKGETKTARLVNVSNRVHLHDLTITSGNNKQKWKEITQ